MAVIDGVGLALRGETLKLEKTLPSHRNDPLFVVTDEYRDAHRDRLFICSSHLPSAQFPVVTVILVLTSNTLITASDGVIDAVDH